jgi:hypothetical protein
MGREEVVAEMRATWGAWKSINKSTNEADKLLPQWQRSPQLFGLILDLAHPQW